MRRSFLMILMACLLCAPTMAASAQEASPTSEGGPIEALFVQTANSSTLTPLDAPEGEATHELVLQEGSAQTVFFADRPGRQAGTIPTSDVLTGFAAEPTNPPNGALVAMTMSGTEEIIVFEIIGGEEDTAAKTVTYQVRILADMEAFDYGLQSEPVTEVTESRTYASSSLFIDDVCITSIYVPIMYPC